MRIKNASYQQQMNTLHLQADFSLCCLAFLVGIGNMLRFPGKVCQYGGIFLVPYLCCHMFIGFPMLYLHLCIGQYAGQTADVAFQRLMPITCGLGWAFILAALPVIIYHNAILTWSLQYLWYSVVSVVISEPLPWENRVTYTALKWTLPKQHIVLALAAAWLLVFAGVCRGTTWMSWAIRFTATIPYLLLFILLIRGLSLPGASLGLTFLFSSASVSISSLKMWLDAAEQVLFEIGVGAGALFSIAAYSRFRNNVYRDAAILITMYDTHGAVLVLRTTLCSINHSRRSMIAEFLDHDPVYMVFTVIPSMTKLMRWGPLWMSILFASIVFTAIDAEFIWVEMLASSVMNLLQSRNRQLNARIIAAICCLGLLFEIPFLNIQFQGGFFLFHSMDALISGLPSFILSFLVLITICYLYGLNKFVSDVSSMLRVPVRTKAKWAHLRLQEKLLELFGPCGAFIRLSWAIICPCFLAILMTAHAISYERPSFFGCRVPSESEFVAWVLVNAPLSVVLIGAVTAVVKVRQDGKTISSLFDVSGWQQEYTTAQYMDSPPPTPSSRKQPKRENTYMYIDPASRGPTVRSNLNMGAENYSWRNGRLREWQISSASDGIRVPSPPAPRVSPCRSEPPKLTADRPAPSIRSRSDEYSHEEFSDSDEDSVRRQRSTIIRRFRSEDSVQAFSTASISVTADDSARQRSLSSVAIFDDSQTVLSFTLSQLKRPAPIETPTRF
ncbi:unnamed protein product [Nippostrongylus brasiliensis]|uniref:Transporter n=1 Tax=Nippostrongylus brasiliensis TaxID=27835 RepID=A0A0N4XDW5_NIPBR|nr:unnamed protein product [Nippostrongylus brasiliensis]